ncbi:MAG: hypothetical protein R2766_01395 [Saprospiraceae bacterium]
MNDAIDVRGEFTTSNSPVNDDCDGAISLTVNSDLNCSTFTSGTISNASDPESPTACSGTENDGLVLLQRLQLTQISLLNVAGSTTTCITQYGKVLALRTVISCRNLLRS